MLNYDRDKKVNARQAELEKKIQTIDMNLTARVEALAAAPAAAVKKQLEETAEELRNQIQTLTDDVTAKDMAYKTMFDELGIDPAEAEELIREMESEVAMSKQMSSQHDIQQVPSAMEASISPAPDGSQAGAPTGTNQPSSRMTSMPHSTIGKTSPKSTGRTPLAKEPSIRKQGTIRRKTQGLTPEQRAEVEKMIDARLVLYTDEVKAMIKESQYANNFKPKSKRPTPLSRQNPSPEAAGTTDAGDASVLVDSQNLDPSALAKESDAEGLALHMRAEARFAGEAKARKEQRKKKKIVTKKVTVHKYTKQFSEEDVDKAKN